MAVDHGSEDDPVDIGDESLTIFKCSLPVATCCLGVDSGGFVALNATLGAYARCWDVLLADSDISGRYRPRHRRDSSVAAAASTTKFYHLLNYRRTASLSVMTTGRNELFKLEHGRHRTSESFGTTTGRMK